MGLTHLSYMMMVDLSKSSVEYLCKNVTSPNIARRFGHKITEGPVQQVPRQIFYQDSPSIERTNTRHSYYRGQESEEKVAMERYQQAVSASPRMDRDLSHRVWKNVNSWQKDPSRAVFPTTAIKNKLSE